jgi:reverse gyrase
LTTKAKVDRVATTEKSGLNRLVIVESPAKARTIEGYLGKGYKVA